MYSSLRGRTTTAASYERNNTGPGYQETYRQFVVPKAVTRWRLGPVEGAQEITLHVIHLLQVFLFLCECIYGASDYRRWTPNPDEPMARPGRAKACPVIAASPGGGFKS